jgi:transcriptional regulator with XRE-family HTH domain
MPASKTKTRKAAPKPDDINEHLGQRVKKLRADHGWSLDDLASSSGVSRSMLSEIERERANPTLAVTVRIARAFGMTISELIETAAHLSTIQVTRANDPQQVFRSDKNCQIRTLSPINLEKDVEFYEVRLRPGGELRSKPHFEGAREFLTVESGKVRIESGQTNEKLGRGDSATYRADVPHAIVNAGSSEAVVFLVVIYR